MAVSVNYQAIADMWDSGNLTLPEISTELSCSTSTVNKVLRIRDRAQNGDVGYLVNVYGNNPSLAAWASTALPAEKSTEFKRAISDRKSTDTDRGIDRATLLGVSMELIRSVTDDIGRLYRGLDPGKSQEFLLGMIKGIEMLTTALNDGLSGKGGAG